MKMAYKKKYQKGDPITSLDELSKQEFVYFQHKIYHSGWFMSWQIIQVKRFIDRGLLYYAEKKVDPNDKL